MKGDILKHQTGTEFFSHTFSIKQKQCKKDFKVRMDRD